MFFKHLIFTIYLTIFVVTIKSDIQIGIGTSVSTQFKIITITNETVATSDNTEHDLEFNWSGDNKYYYSYLDFTVEPVSF